MEIKQEIIDDELPFMNGGPTNNINTSEDEYAFMAFYNQQDISDALQVCCRILENRKIIKNPASESISEKASTLGEEFANAIVTVLKECSFIKQEELILPHDDIPNDNYENEIEQPQASPDSEKIPLAKLSTSVNKNLKTENDSETEDSEDEYDPESERATRKFDYIPLETKIKILNLVKEHPKWSLKTIQRHGGGALRYKSSLRRWQKQIEQGSGMKEKFDMIKKSTSNRFCEARQKMQPVTRKVIQQWASQAAAQHEGSQLSFKASSSWVKRLKAQQRKVHALPKNQKHTGDIKRNRKISRSREKVEETKCKKDS